MAFASGPYYHFPSNTNDGDTDTLPVQDSVIPNPFDTLKRHSHSLEGGRYISKEELDSILSDTVPEHSFIILPDTHR